MIEIRKTITWHIAYEISNLWNIRSSKRWKLKLLKIQKDNWWYSIINLCENSKSKTHTIHRLVAEAFIPNIHNKEQINHKDWNKSNNSIKNLEWCTVSENELHAYSMGLKYWPKSRLWKYWKEHHSSKPVLQYDMNKNFIRERENARLASEWLWISRMCIWKVCNWHQKSCWGHIRSFLSF